jgi:hypothetical protein
VSLLPSAVARAARREAVPAMRHPEPGARRGPRQLTSPRRSSGR